MKFRNKLNIALAGLVAATSLITIFSVATRGMEGITEKLVICDNAYIAIITVMSAIYINAKESEGK